MGATELDRDFITTKVAADLLGVCERTLRRRRMRGYVGPDGPPWYQQWGRVYYRKTEVLAFRLQHRRTSAPPDTRLPRVPPAPTASPAD